MPYKAFINVQVTTTERSLRPVQPITSFKNESGAWLSMFPSWIHNHAPLYVRSIRLKPRSQETNTCRREQTELIWQVKKLADVAKRTPRWRRASIETLRFLRERALVFYRNCVHEAQSELRGPPLSTKPQAARRHDKRPVQTTTLERSLAPLQPITSFKNECGAWFPVASVESQNSPTVWR